MFHRVNIRMMLDTQGIAAPPVSGCNTRARSQEAAIEERGRSWPLSYGASDAAQARELEVALALLENTDRPPLRHPIPRL
jgi:hypothetical protein